MNKRSQVAAGIILFAAVLAAVAIYMPATGGSLHFDDKASLAGLAEIRDTASGLAFIASGQAGPLGRPLALASFVPQAYAWPHAPDVFLYANILLHALNGILIAWVCYLLGQARGYGDGQAAVTGSVSGALWLLLPILASSSLMIVQRMTLLSASFVVIGLIGYLYSRRHLEHRPLPALFGMSSSMITASVLAMLAKENGALLPLFVLVIEATLLARPRRISPALWRGWFTIFLVMPAVLLAGYLALRFQYGEGTLLRRGFTGGERLLTEARILWQYLYQAFLPNTASLGPFHDDQPIHEWSDPLTSLAVVGWLAALATVLYLRRKTPLPAFGLAWFLVGHALESTTIPLELYFEHRNYLPLVGPVFAIVAGALSLGGTYRIPVRTALTAYMLLLGGVLFNVTTLWSNPSLAAEMWAIHNPNSMRATQFLAQRLESDGYHRASKRVLEEFSQKHPDAHLAGVQALTLSCVMEPDRDLTSTVQRMKDELPSATYQSGLVKALTVLHSSIIKGECRNLDQGDVYQLAEGLTRNSAYRAQSASYHNLQLLMGRIGISRRDLGLTMRHFEKALDARHTISTLTLVVEALNGAGLHSSSQSFVEEARARGPRHPIRSVNWDRGLDALEERIDNHRSRVTRDSAAGGPP